VGPARGRSWALPLPDLSSVSLNGGDVIEELMIFTLGFLVACVIALAAAPLYWRRAIRLSTRRLEMQLPLSPEEIRAGRDLLRAEFAVKCRQLEQKAAALNERHAADMAELGRSASIISRQDANLNLLSERGSEGHEELSALRRALMETSAELAAAQKDAYDTSGLLARRDAKISELATSLTESQDTGAKLRQTIEMLEAEVAQRDGALASQRAKIAGLQGEIETLQLQHQADQVTVRAAAARVADREEALEASAKREKDLLRHRALQSEAARAAEAGYLEKIERLRIAYAGSQEALDASRKACDKLAKELEETRMAHLPLEAAGLMHREENEILRQKISEIGAAIIGAASGIAEPSPEQANTEGSLPEPSYPAKASA
jgi:chromosome segregation ATPase